MRLITIISSMIQTRSEYSHFFSSVLIFIALCQPGEAFCQDTSKYIPDGTQGELMKDPNPDTLRFGQRFKDWNEFDGPLTTLRIGGGFLYEYATFSQDEKGKAQMDSAHIDLNPGVKVRDFRVTLSGKFKFKRAVTWKIGIMYDGPSDNWLFRESGVMVEVPEIYGHIFVGRTKEGFSLNKVMNGYAGWTMERQMALDIIPILADGVKWLGYLPEPRILWNIGVFADWLSEGHSFSTYQSQFAARIGWLPVYSESDNTILHIAVNGRYGRVHNDSIRVRSRPEAFTAPYFVDTKVFPAQSSNHFGLEAYYREGPLILGGEYYFCKFNSPEKHNPLFHGGDFVATYVITGESRPYSTVTGIFGFVPVATPVTEGGPGAWEAVLRFSNLDLDGGIISGGSFWRITPMINWYLSSQLRLEVSYGYGILDRFTVKGSTQFFQTRIQITI
jgi:phosphate-selective porin OprO and OprP